MVLVAGICNAALEGDRRKLGGAWQRHFDVTRAVRFQERQLVAGERPYLVQLFGHDACDATDRSGSFISRFPVSGYGIAEIETFDGVREVTPEIAAAQFSIGKNFKIEFLLFRQHTLDVLILKGVQLLVISG